MGTDHVHDPRLVGAVARDLWTAAAICAAVTVGCGSSRPASPLAGMNVSVSTVEWRAPIGDPGIVDVEIVVDGNITKLGSIAATPENCAIRTAAAKTTEFLCADSTFDANLEPGYVVVSRDGREVRRIEIGSSVAISVAPYQIPTAPAPADASVP